MTVPAALNNLTISTYMAGTDARIVLHWVCYGLQNDDFAKIERSTDGSNWALYDTAPTYTYAGYSGWGSTSSVTCSYTDGNGGNRSGTAYTLTAGQKYWYRIRNENHNEWTGYADNNSTGVSIVAGVSETLPAPTNFAVTAILVNSLPRVVGTWTDMTGETGYCVYKQKYNTLTAGWETDGLILLESTTGFLPANAIIFTDTYVVNNTRYRYSIAGFNDTETGLHTVWKEVISGIGTGVAAPSSLFATVISTTRIDLAWLDNATDETGYVVERNLYNTYNNSYDSNAWVILTDSLAVDSVFYSDTACSSTAKYKYRVKAVRNTVSSAYAEVEINGGGSVPNSPSLTGSYADPSVNLTWTYTGTTHTGFVLEKALGTGTFTVLANLGKDVRAYNDSSVIVGNTYSYRIKAVIATGDSAYGTFTITIGGGSGSDYGISDYGGANPSNEGTIIRDNYMENNGMGNIDPQFYISPKVTIDNPSISNEFIRYGIRIY
jgi:titin